MRHLEIDLSGSDLHYQVGDALGVWFNNDPALVQEFLDTLGLSGEESVANQALDLRRALLSLLELTQLTAPISKAYAEITNQAELNEIVADGDKLAKFVAQTPIIGLLQRFPAQLSATQIVALLRPLAPRLYSISSSPAEVGEEVHLSVGVVRFEHNGKALSGTCSSYLADRVE